MYIKLYQYHILPENEQKLMVIQQKAGQVYRNYDVQTKLPLINSDPIIRELYKKFESLLISDIREEEYEEWL